jgi:hypothetical protein
LKDLAFRQFQFFDSSSVNISKNIGFEFFSNIRLSERGELFWDDFKEKPADNYVDQTYAITISYKPSDLMSIGVGYKTYLQKRYIYNSNVKDLDFQQTNHGPMTHLVYQFDNNFRLNVEGWYEIVSTPNQMSSGNRNLTIDLFYYF